MSFFALAIVFGLSTTTQAQVPHADGPVPSFEVATIRPWNPPPPPPAPPPGEEIITESVMKVSSGPPAGQVADRVRLIGNIKLLIAMAYELHLGQESRVLDLPSWAEDGSQRYEINAKIDDTTLAALKALSPSEQRHRVSLMEQQLLAERLHLKVHMDTRDLPIFELVVSKGGPRLTPSQPGEATTVTAIDHQGSTDLTAVGATLNDFAHAPMFLSTPAISNHDIVNHTGLTDRYDFKLRYAIERPGADTEPSDAPSLFTAIQEQLGLKLVPTKGPSRVIVVDHIERLAEN